MLSNWRDIRSVKALRTFLAEFNGLTWVDKEPILQDMTALLDDHTRDLPGFGIYESMEKMTRQVAPRKRRRRRQ